MRLNQITLPCSDVPAALDFYRKLGLTLVVDSAPRYVRLACPDEGSTLSLEAGQPGNTESGPVIYFECDDLASRVAELQASGLTFGQLPVMQPWLWCEARLRDPDGREVCLYHAGENRLNPPWRVLARKEKTDYE